MLTIQSLVLLLTSITILLLGLICLFRISRQNHLIIINFFLLSLSLSFWILSFFISSLTINHQLTLLGARTTSIGALFFPFQFLLFSMSLTNKKIRFWFVASMYVLLSTISFVSITTQYYIKDIVIAGRNFDYFSGNYYYAVPFLLLLFLLAGLIILIVGYRHQDNAKKNQIIYLFVGVFLATLTGAITNIFLPLLNIKIFNYFGPFGTIFFVAFTAYAITKHRLMNISVVISRTVAHALTIGFLGSIYLLITYSYVNLFSHRIDIPFVLLTIIYGILVGETFSLIRNRLQTATDRAFIKDWYDYRAVQREINSKLAKAMTDQNIIDAIAPTLDSQVEVRGINFFFKDKGQIKEDDPFVQKITAQKDVFALAKEDKVEGSICVPAFSEDQLIAYIILGKKRSEAEYSGDDMDLFRTIRENMEVALEYKIRPYEEVKQKFERTERMLVEAEKQLERSQRLSSLGRIIAEVAHEIKNPLTVVVARIEKIKKKAADTKFVQESADLMMEKCDRITKIVRTMRTLTKEPDYKPQKIQISQPIENALRFLPQKSNIVIEKQLADVPPIMGDEDELERVFINLFTNALDAMGDNGGKISVTTSSPVKNNVKMVQIIVADTGPGIKNEDLPKIFEPFFSTKFGKFDDRIGFGLAIVHDIIVEKHRGTIQAESAPGKGTTFIIALPVADKIP
ncbi:MAG: ATP-binding protein [Candidatus Margulisiibacteriota bacterium]